MSILARRQLRLAALTAIQTVTGVTVQSPGDWDTPPSKLPAILLRCGDDNKSAVTRSMPEFTTVSVLEVLARVEGDTAEAAQDAIEDLGQRIEQALLGNAAFVKLCQQFPNARTRTVINADGKKHFGGIQMLLECELFEAFDPTDINPAGYPALQQMGVHVDTARPFDADGTYANPPFPDAVPAAPRTTGPDGRDEGTLELDLT